MSGTEDEVRYKVSPSLVDGLTTLAYVEDYSLVLVAPEGLQWEDRELVLALPTDFADFSRLVSADLERYRDTFKRVKGATIASGWINSPPFQRMMREHWFWAWFELVEVLRLACTPAQAATRLLVDLSPIEQRYSKVVVNKAGTLVSSTVSFVESRQGLLKELEPVFKRFNAVVGEHWTRTNKVWDREIGARYSPKAFARAVNARRVQRPGELRQERRPGSFISAFGIFPSVAADAEIADIAQLSVLLSLDGSIDAGRSASPEPQITQELKTHIQGVARQQSISRPPKFSRGLAELVEARNRLGLMSWGRYFQESLSLLEARLRQHSYVSIAPTQLFSQERSRFWDRTCRFLCRVLLASEVTVYRLRIAEKSGPLELRGSFCEGPHGREKSEYKAKFMHDAASDPASRVQSASYRAADRNQAQFAPSQDGALRPPSDEWHWGHSVLSVPIVNNGGVWGVIEFIADRPRQFGSLLAPQCEAAAALISTNLMVGSLFEALSQLDTYALNPPLMAADPKETERRSQLCATLADVFSANSLKLFIATKDSRHVHFKVNEYGEWAASAALWQTGDATEEVRAFLDDSEMQSKEASGEVDLTSPTGITRRFLVRLSAETSNAWAGALSITVPETVDVDAVWTRNLFALGKALAPSIANITAAQSWGPASRRQIRHENGRVFNTLEGIRAGLRDKILSKGRRDLDRALARLGERDRGDVSAALADVWRSVEDAVVDLGTGISSMDLIISALSYDIYDALLTAKDKRIIGLQQSKEKYLTTSRKEVDLRDVAMSTFQTAIRSAPDQRLRLSPPASHPPRLIVMDPAAVTAVLGSLAENAVKYSARGSDIIMTFREMRDGGLRLTISNMAPPLLETELNNVFDHGVRGQTAKRTHPDQGEGLGLGFAREAMELWDGFLDYDNEAFKTGAKEITESGPGEQQVWHRLSLTFPRSLVV